jgi:hypothetical protein
MERESKKKVEKIIFSLENAAENLFEVNINLALIPC